MQSKAYIPSPRTSQIMEYFLKHVGYGEQKEAEAMLRANRNLALAHGDLTDCSIDPETNAPRTWHNITAYQYAILVLDYHMWTMIQTFMNPEEIREQLEELNNFATLKEEGWIINSISNNKWPSVGWNKLIEALDTYVTYYQVWRDSQCRKHWCQQVGGAQLILPAHIINEYRYPNRPFYPCPNWGDNEETLPRTGVDKWQEIGFIPHGNNDVVKYILGKSFAWCNGSSNQQSSWGSYSQSKTKSGVKPHVGGHFSCNGSIQEDIKAKIEEKQKHSFMAYSMRDDSFFWSENNRKHAEYERPKAIIENLMPIAEDRAALHELLIVRVKQARSLIERQLLNKKCKLAKLCI